MKTVILAAALSGCAPVVVWDGNGSIDVDPPEILVLVDIDRQECEDSGGTMISERLCWDVDY